MPERVLAAGVEGVAPVPTGRGRIEGDGARRERPPGERGEGAAVLRPVEIDAREAAPRVAPGPGDGDRGRVRRGGQRRHRGRRRARVLGARDGGAEGRLVARLIARLDAIEVALVVGETREREGRV